MRLLHIPRWVFGGIVMFWIASLITDLLSLRLETELQVSEINWPHVFTKLALLRVYWIVATVLAFEVMHGCSGSIQRRRIALRASLLSVFGCAGIVVWFGLIASLLSSGQRSWLMSVQLLRWVDLLSMAVTAIGIALSAIAFDYYQRAMQRERESETLRLKLAQTELTLLRGQLEPHFLFNALNSIAALVRLKRSNDAVDSIARLADLLRGILELGQRVQVPWSWERSFTEAYLALQKLRFEDLLNTRFDSNLPDNLLVPPLLLQTLIENAIRHGSLVDGGRCPIEVDAAFEHDHVVIHVENWPSKTAASASAGFGLSNLADRLARLYGADARLEAGIADNRRFRVLIRFPVQYPEASPA